MKSLLLLFFVFIEITIDSQNIYDTNSGVSINKYQQGLVSFDIPYYAHIIKANLIVDVSKTQTLDYCYVYGLDIEFNEFDDWNSLGNGAVGIGTGKTLHSTKTVNSVYDVKHLLVPGYYGLLFDPKFNNTGVMTLTNISLDLDYTLLGDDNMNGTIDAYDLTMLGRFANEAWAYRPQSDIDRDGDNDLDDLKSVVDIQLNTWMGDADLDGDVDVHDLNALALNWQGAGTWATGDFNGDGIVNASDLNYIGINWQNGIPDDG